MIDNVEHKVYSARGALPPDNLEAVVTRRYHKMFGEFPSYYRYMTMARNSINDLYYIVEVDGFRLAVPDQFLDFPLAWRLAETKGLLRAYTLGPSRGRFLLEDITHWHLKRRKRRLDQQRQRRLNRHN